MNHSIRKLLLGGVAALATFPAFAGDVTPDRLVNADKEPHNWLMNHRTYDAQRYSPLDKINKDTVKNLKLAYAVAIGGTAANENLQSTPLAEDGFLYIVDQWGVVYKIDVRSGDMGRIVWRMDPGQEKLPLSNRGARRRRRETDRAQIRHTGAGRARQRDLEGQEQRLADRRRRHVDHGLVRSRDQPGDLGHRQSGADVRSDLSSRRQPLHQQHDLVESRQREHELVLPVRTRRHVGLRRGALAHPHRRSDRRSAAQADHPFRP